MLFPVLAPTHPAGATHEYVIPLTAGTEYVCVLPAHTDAVPVMLPGEGGCVTGVAESEVAALVPQPLEAVTDIVPGPEPTVTLMTFVVLDPVQPEGIVQL